MKHDITIQANAKVTVIGKIRGKNAKPVFCLDNGKIYASTMDVSEILGASQGLVSHCCLGQRESTKGMHFCYVEDIPNYLDQISKVLQEKSEFYDKYSNKVAEMEANEKIKEAERIKQEAIDAVNAKAKQCLEDIEQKFRNLRLAV